MKQQKTPKITCICQRAIMDVTIDTNDTTQPGYALNIGDAKAKLPIRYICPKCKVTALVMMNKDNSYDLYFHRNRKMIKYVQDIKD